MKTLNFYPLAIFIVLTFMLGCSEYIDNYQSTWEYQYEQAIEKSLEASKPKNRIFLNFELGMSEKAFDFHQKTLIEEKKLVPSVSISTNQFASFKADSLDLQYLLKLKSATYHITYTPVFEDDRLVQLDLELRPDISGQDLNNLYREVFETCKNKYGSKYMEKKQIYGSNDFFWLSSNRQLKISKSIFSIHMVYSDLNWYDQTVENVDYDERKEPNDKSMVITDL